MNRSLEGNDIYAKDLELLGQDPEQVAGSLPDRVSHRIKHWAKETPSATAVVFEERSLSYGEFARLIDGTKEELIRLGVRPGDRVMIVCENSLALVGLLLAISELNAWAVVVNARLSDGEIDRIRDHCDPRRVVFTTRISEEARHHAQRSGAETVVLKDLDEVAVSPVRDCEPEPVADSNSDQVFVMIYTTGTTGDPKGVMLTHRNIGYVSHVAGCLREITSRDRIYAVLPLSHAFGLSSVVFSTLFAGGCVCLETRFSPEKALEALDCGRITGLFGVPAMFVKIMEHLGETGAELRMPDLRFIYAGGSPLDPTIKANIEELFHLPLHNGYGLTETSPTLSQTRLFAPVSDTSVGPILPGIETRLVDAEDGGQRTADQGELWVRGPSVMKGYFRAPERTSEVKDQQGWLNTGDVVRVEEKGNLYIVGRTK